MADPVPMTPAQMGGALTAAVFLGKAVSGPYRDMFLAYQANADLINAIGHGQIVMSQGRTAPGGTLTIDPTTTVADEEPQTVTITANSAFLFTPDTVVFANGVPLTTTFVDEDTVTAPVPREAAGTVTITVRSGQLISGPSGLTVTVE